MLTRHTVCAVLLVFCILQAIVSALPTDSNRILRSKNIHRFVPKTEAALMVEGSISDKNEFSSQSGSSGSQNVLSNQNNENEENVGETQESKVEEYQCSDSHSTNPNPGPEHTHIRKKIVRRRIKRKANNPKKKVNKGNAQDIEIEQGGDTTNLVTKSSVGMPRRDKNISKNQVKDNEESNSYEDNALLKDKKLFGKQRKQTNINGRSKESDKISSNVNNETEGEEETEFLVEEENNIVPQKEMNQKKNKLKSEVKNTNTQQQIKSNGKNKLLKEKGVENDSEYLIDENEEGREEVESTLQHLNYTKARTHMKKRANNRTKTDDQNPEEEDAEEVEEEKSNKIPTTEDVKPHIRKKAATKRTASKPGQKLEQSEDEETSVKPRNKKLKRGKQLGKLEAGSNMKTQSEVSSMDEESPADESEQAEEDSSIQPTQFSQQKTELKQTTADNKDTGSPSKLETRTIKNSKSRPENKGDDDDVEYDDVDDEEEVEKEECTIPHNENTEGHKHIRKKSVKKEKEKEDKDVTLKQPERSKNKKLLTGTQYGKSNTKSNPTAETQGTVDRQLKSNNVKKGPTDNVNLRNPSEPKRNKELTDNENTASSSQQMKRVKPNGKKGVDEDVLSDNGDDEEEEEEVDEEECVLPHTKDSLPHKHTRRAVKYDKPQNKNEDGDLGRKTTPDTNKTEIGTKKGGKKKTDLRKQGSVGKDTVSDYDDEEEEEEEEEEENKERLIQHGNYTAPHTHKKEKSKNKKQSNERNPAINKTQRITEGKNDVTEEQIDDSKPQREISEIPAKDKKQSADSRTIQYTVNLPNTPVIGNSEPANNNNDIQDGSRQKRKGKNKYKSEENFKQFSDSDDEEEIEEEECTIPHNENTEPHKHSKKVKAQDKRSNGQIQGKNNKEKSKATKKISPEDSKTPEAQSNINTVFNKPQVDNKNPSKKVKPKSKTSKLVEQLISEDGMAVPYETTNTDSSNQKQTPETATTKIQTDIEGDEETFDEDENSSVSEKPRRPLNKETNKRNPTESKDTELSGDTGKPNSIIGQIPRSKTKTKNNPNNEITTDSNKDDLYSVKFNNKQNIPSDSEKKLDKKKPKPYNQRTNDDDEEDDEEEEEEEVEEEECVLPHNDSTGSHKHTRRLRENDKTDGNQESEKTSKPSDKQSKLPSQETNYIPQKEMPRKYRTPTGRNDTQPLVRRQKTRDTKKEINEPNNEPNIESTYVTLKQSKAPKSVTAFNISKGKPKLNAETDKTSGYDKDDLSEKQPSTSAFSNNRNQLGKLITKPYNKNVKSPTNMKDNTEKDISQLNSDNNKTPDDKTEQPKTQKSKKQIKNTNRNKAKPMTNVDTAEIPEDDSDQPGEDLSETSDNKVSPNNGKDTSTLNSPSSKSPNHQGTQVTASGNSETYADAEEESPDDDDEEVEKVEEEECMIPHNDTTGPHKHIRKRKANKPEVNKELNSAKEGKIFKISQYKKNKVGDKQINNDKRSKLPSEESDDIPNNKISEKYEMPSGRNQKPRDTKKETNEPENKNIELPDVILKQSKAPKAVTPPNKNKVKPNAETGETSDNDEETEEDTIKKQPSSVPFTNDRKQSVEMKTKPYNVNVKSPTKDDTGKDSSQLDSDNNKTQDNTVEQPKTQESKTKIKNTFGNKAKPKRNIDTGEIPEDDSRQPGEDLSKTPDNKVLPNNGKDTSTFNSPNSKFPDHQGTQVTASGNSETYAEAEEESPDDDDEAVEEVEEKECMIPHNDTTGPHKHIRKRKVRPDVNQKSSGAKEGKISKPSQYKKNKIGEKKINNDKRSKLPSEESDSILNNKISEKYETLSGRRQKPRDTKKENSEPDNKNIESPDVILKQSKAPKAVTPSNTYEGKPKVNAETGKTSDIDEESEGDTIKKQHGSKPFTLKQSGRLKTKPYKLNAKLPIDKKDDTEEDVSKLDDEMPDDINEQPKTLKSQTKMESGNGSKPKPKTNEKPEDDYLEQPEKGLSQKHKDFPGNQNGSSIPSSLNSKSPNQESSRVTASGKSQAYAGEEDDSPDDDEEEIEEEECTIPHNNSTGPHKHTRKKKTNTPDSSQPMKGSNQGKTSSPSQYEKTTAGTDFENRSKLPSKDTDDLLSETFSTPTEKDKSGSLRNNQKSPKDTRRETSALDDDETKSIGVETKQSETPNSKNKINPRNVKNKLKSGKTPSRNGDEVEPEDDTFKKQASNVLLNNQNQPSNLKTKPYNVNTNYSNQPRIAKYQSSGESKNEAHGDGNVNAAAADDDDDDEEVDEEECTIPHDNFTGPHKHTKKRIKNNKQENKKKTKNNNNEYLKGNKGTNGVEDTGNVLPSEETGGKPYNKRSQTGKSRPLINIQKAPISTNTEDNDAKSQDDIPKESEITKTPKERNVSQKERNKQKPQKLTDRDKSNPEDVEEESEGGFTKPPNSMIQLHNKKTSDNEKAKPGKSKAMPEKTKSPNENEEQDDYEEEEEVEEEECTIPHFNNTGPHRHTRRRRNRKNNVTEGNQKVESTIQGNTKTPSQYLKDGNDETGTENNKRSKMPSQGTNDTPDNGKSDNYETPTAKRNSQPFGMSQKPSKISEEGNRNLDGNVESPDDLSQLSTTKKSKNMLNDTTYGKKKEKPQKSREIDENPDEKQEENELESSSNRMISNDKNSKPNNLNTKSPIQQFIQKKPSKKNQPSPDKQEESLQFIADKNDDYDDDEEEEEEEEVDKEECTIPHNNSTRPHKHTRRPIKYNKIGKKKKPLTDKRAKASETPKDNNNMAETEYGKRSNLPSDETNDLANKVMPENYESPSGKDDFRPSEKSQKSYNKSKGRIKAEKGSDTKSDDEEEPEEDKLKIQATNNQNISADVKTKPYKIHRKFPVENNPQLTSSGKYNEKDDEENDISQVENNGTESPEDTFKQFKAPKGKNIIGDTQFNKDKTKPQKDRGFDENDENDSSQLAKSATNKIKKPTKKILPSVRYSKPNSLTTKSPNQQVTANGKLQAYAEKEERPIDEDDNEEDEEDIEEACTIPHNNISGLHKHMKRRKETNKMEDIQNPDTVKERINSNTPQDLQSKDESTKTEYDKRSKDTNELLDKIEAEPGKDNSRQLGKPKKPSRETKKEVIETYDNDNDSSGVTSKQSKIPKDETAYNKNDFEPKVNTESGKNTDKHDEKDSEVDRDNDNENESEDEIYEQPRTLETQNKVKGYNTAKSKPNIKSDKISGDNSQQQEKGLNKNPSGTVLFSNDNSLPKNQQEASGKLQANSELSLRSKYEDDDNDEEEEVEEEECTLPHNNNMGPHKHTRKIKKNSKPEDSINTRKPVTNEGKKLLKISQYVKKKGTMETDKLVPQETSDLPYNDKDFPSEKYETPSEKNNSGTTFDEVQKPSVGTRSVLSEIGDNDVQSSDDTVEKGKNKIKQRPFNKNIVKQKPKTESAKISRDDKGQPEENTSLNQPVSIPSSSNHKDIGDKETIRHNLNKESPYQRGITSGKFRVRKESRSESSDDIDNDDDDDDEEEVDEEDCVIPHDNLTGSHKHTRRKNKNGKIEGGLQPENKNSKKPKTNVRTVPGNSELQAANQTLNDNVGSSNIDKPVRESGNAAKRKKTQQIGTVPGSKSPARQNSQFNSTYKILPYTKNNIGTPEKYGKKNVENLNDEGKEDDDDGDDEEEEEEEEEVEEEDCIIPHTSTTEPHEHTKDMAKLKEYNDRQKLVAEGQNKLFSPQRVSKNRKPSLRGRYNVKSTAQNQSMPESDETYTEESLKLNIDSSQKRPKNKTKKIKLKYDKSSGATVENEERSSGHSPNNMKEETQIPEAEEIVKTGDANKQVEASALPTSSRRSLVYPEFHGENNNNCYGSTPSSGSTPLESYKTRQGYNNNQGNICDLDPRKVSVDVDNVIVEDPKAEDDSDASDKDTDENSKPESPDSSCKTPQDGETESQSKWPSTGGNGMGGSSPGKAVADANSATNPNANWMAGSPSGWPSMPFFNMGPFMYASGFPQSSNCKPQPSSTYAKMQPFMYHKPPTSKNQKYGQPKNKFKTNPKTYMTQSAKSWSGPGSSGGVKCQVQTSPSGPGSFKTATYKYPFTKKW